MKLIKLQHIKTFTNSKLIDQTNIKKHESEKTQKTSLSQIKNSFRRLDPWIHLSKTTCFEITQLITLMMSIYNLLSKKQSSLFLMKKQQQLLLQMHLRKFHLQRNLQIRPQNLNSQSLK